MCSNKCYLMRFIRDKGTFCACLWLHGHAPPKLEPPHALERESLYRYAPEKPRPLSDILRFPLAHRRSGGGLQNEWGMRVSGLGVRRGRPPHRYWPGIGRRALERESLFWMSIFNSAARESLRNRPRRTILRMDGEARADGPRRHWHAALVKFRRGELKRRSVQL